MQLPKSPSIAIMLLFVTCLFVAGCDTFNGRKTIPLASGDAPYQLPAGNYVDTKGMMHEEKTNRWSLSEQDLFKASTPEVLKPPSQTLSKIKEILILAVGYLILGSIILLIIGVGLRYIYKKIVEKVLAKHF